MHITRSSARRWQVAGVGAVAVALVGVGLGVASAAENSTPTVNCPSVAAALGSIPAQSQAEIERNLALLNTQIDEANKRLAASSDKAGFSAQNSVIGPLKDKRVSTIDRMVISIGRHATPPKLDENALATCSLNENGGGVAAPEPTAVQPAAGGNNGGAAEEAAGGATGTQTISCPAVAGALGAVPAQAQAEIERNLALLNTQIAEANKRLSTSANEGGPNFVQNAILGPLKDKRVATINRMATAIGRSAAKPVLDVDTLATCTLGGAGGAAATPEPTGVATADPAAASGDAPTVNCPDVAGLPSIPAEAQDEVSRNLELLQTQIDEANKRLSTSANEGGPNFVQNAILGPLEDKRVATLNRIETAIGRHAAKPEGLEKFAPCTLNN
ncbi:hypothetical protein [Actinoplanes sp. N902-109]|uniref:hypothetical protein n=1 Tax=Actinoplanes sp. (strain N902-109) TaxID=649831 RepID=UPI0003295820|nr:hypothetical protein [Actinoplanes sp. N902-109]AGL18800.1 hypothetical protein L083_5290 [Actinoplanes sp. N902-109]